MQQTQLTIQKAATARIFEDRKRVRLLEPFIQEPRTLSEAANKLGIKAPRLHYHVKRFLEHGLLEVAGTTKRNGRTVKLYRTTARAFFVPFELTSSESLERLVTNLAAPSRATLLRYTAQTLEQLAPDWGLRWSSNKEEGLEYEMLPKTMSREETNRLALNNDSPAVLAFHITYSLEHEIAKSFQRELLDLAERCFSSQKPGAQRYMFSIALAPIPSD